MGCVIVLNVIKFIFLRLLQYLHGEFSPQTLIPLYLQFFAEKIPCFRVSAFLKSQHHDLFHQSFFRWCLHDNNWRRNPFWRLVGFIPNLHATDRLTRAIHDRKSNVNMSSYTAAAAAFADFIFGGKIFIRKHIWFVKCQSIWKKNSDFSLMLNKWCDSPRQRTFTMNFFILHGDEKMEIQSPERSISSL